MGRCVAALVYARPKGSYMFYKFFDWPFNSYEFLTTKKLVY
jgi:hypothetical protein